MCAGGGGPGSLILASVTICIPLFLSTFPSMLIVNCLHLSLVMSAPSAYLYPTLPVCLCQIVCFFVSSVANLLPQVSDFMYNQ